MGGNSRVHLSTDTGSVTDSVGSGWEFPSRSQEAWLPALALLEIPQADDTLHALDITKDTC